MYDVMHDYMHWQTGRQAARLIYCTLN